MSTTLPFAFDPPLDAVGDTLNPIGCVFLRRILCRGRNVRAAWRWPELSEVRNGNPTAVECELSDEPQHSELHESEGQSDSK